MKKLILTTLLAMAFMPIMHAQENAVRVPSGYQGFLEQGTLFRVADEMNTSLCVSTTHGFYFGEHTYIGIGVSLEGCEKYFAMPVFTTIKYNFNYRHQVTPTMQVRVGSYLSERVGSYLDAAFGFRFGSSRDFAINLLLTGTLYSNNKSETYDMELHDYVTNTFNTSGVGVRIGIEW